jgi:hypothetical protein
MWDVLLDGAFILRTYAWECAIFFITIMGLGRFAVRALTWNRTETIMPALASAGIGVSILSVGAFCVIAIAHIVPEILKPASFIIIGLALLLLARDIKSAQFKTALTILPIIALVSFAALLIVRYAFIAHIILPPYSDSPIHYRVIAGFLDSAKSRPSNLSLGSIFSNYYHFGFHAISAWLIAQTNIPIGNAMALLGQSFLVIAPMSVIVLTYELTKDFRGAWIAGVFAATGWLMPSFAINWGKYPAVAALAILPAVLAYLSRLGTKQERKALVILLALLIAAGTALLHTRSIFVIVVAASSWLIAGRILPGNEMKYNRAIFFSGAFALSLAPLAPLIKDFYNSAPILIGTIALLPFAFRVHARLALSIFLFIFGAWLITISPLPLLDRQFLEILLYIPFALMIGAGFSGMIAQITPGGIVRPLITSAVIGIVIWIFIQTDAVYPDRCCDYFQSDDQTAFEWIAANGNDHSLFITASFRSETQVNGTDAGVWIETLLDQSVNKIQYDTDWLSAKTAQELCATGAKEIYIYAGGRAYSFNAEQLSASEWFMPVFRAGSTAIFKVSQCPP